MAAFALTPSQQAAVEARGSAILVSAAAGSGKTRVLVERLLRYVTDPDKPCDIDRFLVITYTHAAAAELRGRILEGLDKRCAEAPGDRHLRRQANLCARAQISTIHSFCTSLLREHAHLLGLPPDFRVADEDRARVIRRRVLDRLMDEAYEDIEENEGFRRLVDTVGAGRDDSRLAEVVLELHDKLRSHPWPEDWAKQQRQQMELSDTADVGETLWGRELLEGVRLTAEYWAGELDGLLEQIYAPGSEAMAKAYGSSVEETAEAVRDLARACAQGWDKVREYLPIPFPRLGALRKFHDPALAEYVKLRRDACKKAMQALEADMSGSSAGLLAELKATVPAMEALLEMALKLDKAFSKEKLRQGLLDFSDLEHRTLELLVQRETGMPTPAALAVRSRFTEIMVDEYQDVNRVQELIFRAVSREEKNLFMVGDVKQSIYRFRLAEPGIFIEKYLTYGDCDFERPVSTDGKPRRILLQQNFRSRACVLEAANFVFSAAMSRQLGEIDYDEAARLIPGAAYPPEGESPVRLMTVAVTDDEEDSPDKTELEARAAAREIRALVEAGTSVWENGVSRPVRYGDIVVLMRSPGRPGGVWRQVLMEEGVPVQTAQNGGFFASVEISVMLSLMTVLDNPHQDIPLISVLRSSLFGFTADELSQIRARDKSADFYTALEKAAEKQEKCAAFLEKLQQLRDAAARLPVDELLWRVCRSLDLFALFGAMPDGQARVRNLFLLMELARSFESGGYRGLFRFVAQLRRMMERGEEPSGGDGGGDCVRIMSIHKSKGLEFPIVFLADTARQFNKQDAMKTVLIHAELGLGGRYTDMERGLEYPTVARQAIARRIVSESLSEELRVLYVAMTRAKERLVITCALRNPEQAVEKLAAQCPARPVLPPTVLSTQRSMAQWLLLCALLPGSPLRLELHGVAPEREAEESAAAAEADPTPAVSGELLEQIAGRLEFRYPFAASVDVPSKLTATELKAGRSRTEEEAAEGKSLLPRQSAGFRRPDFAPAVLDAAQRGTATHLFLQYVDFAQTGSAEQLRGELEKLVRQGRLGPEQAAVVDLKAAEGFFASELGRRLQRADEVFREFRFSLLAPAEMFYPEAVTGDELLLQGVVDCCIREGEQLTVVDFKTDRVDASGAEARAELYRGQLGIYGYAMSRILGKPVRQLAVYFLTPGREIFINP